MWRAFKVRLRACKKLSCQLYIHMREVESAFIYTYAYIYIHKCMYLYTYVCVCLRLCVDRYVRVHVYEWLQSLLIHFCIIHVIFNTNTYAINSCINSATNKKYISIVAYVDGIEEEEKKSIYFLRMLCLTYKANEKTTQTQMYEQLCECVNM